MNLLNDLNSCKARFSRGTNTSHFASTTFKGILIIVRLKNSLLAGLGVFVGLLGSFGTVQLQFVSSLIQTNFLNLLIAYWSTVFIAAGGYTINDYYDYEIDCVNCPNRPLPMQMLSRSAAKGIAYVLLLLGLFFACCLLNFIAISFAFFGVLAVISYGKYFKRKKEIGNFLVGFLTVIPFIYGGIIVQRFSEAMIPVCFAFLLSLSREIYKDIEDIIGDKNQKISSFAIRFGERTAIYLANAFLIVLFFVYWFTILNGNYRSFTFITIAIIISTIILIILFKTFIQTIPDLHELSSDIQHGLKKIMILGTIAFILNPLLPIFAF